MGKKRIKLYALLLVMIVALSLYIYTLLKDDAREPYVVDIYLINQSFGAVAEVLIFDEVGNESDCTAFAFAREGNKYRFLISAHCVTKKIYMGDHELNIVGDNLYGLVLRSLETGKNSSHFGRLVAVDINNKIGDLAVLEAEIERPRVELLSFSRRPAESGECVFNISHPKEGTGNVFLGYVATNKNPFARWIYPKDSFKIKFESIKDARGTSGSAVQRCVTGEVIGLVTARNKGYALATKVEYILEFLDEVEKGNFIVPRTE